MSKFFDTFPRLEYDIQGGRNRNLQLTTDIFFRLRIVRNVLGNISSYYEYAINDEDTPEIIADKIYGDPEAFWIILLANDILDAQYDWPLNTRDFNKYLVNKYGSTSNAQSTFHHYEKVIVREEQASGTIVESRYQINPNTYTFGVLSLTSVNGDFIPGETITITPGFSANVQSWNNTTAVLTISNESRTANTTLKFQTLVGQNSAANGVVSSIASDVPFDYYYGLAQTQAVSTYNLVDGKTVVETIYRDRISNYDWEFTENENKRFIKIIKPEFYPQIIRELNNATGSTVRYVRKLV